MRQMIRSTLATMVVAGLAGAQAPVTRIMPLGDLITEAAAGAASYRFFLWHRLVNAGYCVDFVGSKTGVHRGQPKYSDFDQHHESHTGYRTDQLAARAYAWAKAASPDMVLVHAGTEDLWQKETVASTVKDHEKLIDELRRANPDVHVMVAKIIPYGTKFSIDVTPLNNALAVMARAKTTARSPVTIVDHGKGWNTKIHTDNDVHPNHAGDARMARTWFQAIVAAKLPVCRSVNPDGLRVMPLGDSITEAENGYASYRYFLAQQLRASGHRVDFVGSKVGVRGGVPKYAAFDKDHEGHWGWRADQVLAKIAGWAEAARPDVVLCHLGTNDLWQGQKVSSTVTELGLLIDALRAQNSDVTILLAKIIPVGPKFKVDVRPLNAALPALVASKHTAKSPVILVDHFTGWDPKLHTYDDVHANELGEKRLADTWHKAILKLGLTAQAVLAPFGTGCPGSNGSPTLAAAANQRPVLGTSFTVNVGSLPTGATPVFGVMGVSDAKWAALPLPLDLDPFGMPGCWLRVSFDFVVPLGTQQGSVLWQFSLPLTPAFAGERFFLQAYVADASANVTGASVSNGLAGLTGLR